MAELLAQWSDGMAAEQTTRHLDHFYDTRGGGSTNNSSNLYNIISIQKTWTFLFMKRKTK